MSFYPIFKVMSNGNLELLIGGKAYKLFQSELGKHLDSARSLVKGNRLPSIDECYQAGASFHTIRGGAGFFGLTELAQVAGNLESMLMSGNKEMLDNFSEVRQLVDRIEALAAKLPNPPKEEP